MRSLTYLAVLETDEEGGYSVFFPDIPGCFSYGDDIIHAQKMAKEALELHIFSMEEEVEELPKPTIKGLKVADGNIVVPITIFPDVAKVESDNYKVKTNCTLPQWLKRRAESEGINFSQELQRAIKEKLCIT
ncbi:MAG: HicB family protein [Treponema sp.]|nr:MAG: HicB family protein [Treponema sp.]